MLDREVAPLSADQIFVVLWNLVGSLCVGGFPLGVARSYLEALATSDRSFWEDIQLAAGASRLSREGVPSVVVSSDDVACFLIACGLGSLVAWCPVEDVRAGVRLLVRSLDTLLANIGFPQQGSPSSPSSTGEPS